MIKKYVFGLFIVAGGLLSAVHPLSASAQVTPQIFISEINWAGSSFSSADEWVRLYNAGPSDVDASGFVLNGAATSGEALALALGTIIPAGDDLLISNYDLGAKSVLTEKPDLVTTALSLPNSGLHIALTLADGTALDEVNFGSTPKFGSTDPFMPAFRDLATLEWETASSEPTPEPPPTPPLEGGESITIIEENAPSTSPINGGEIEQAPNIEITLESVVTEPVVEMSVIEVPAESTPEPTINEISVVETEAEIISAVTPPAMEGTGEAIVVDEVITAEVVELPTAPVVTDEPITEPALVEAAEMTPVEMIEITLVDAATNSDSTPVSPNIEVETIIIPEAPIHEFSSGAIIINEVMSDPSDGIEWIELFNPGIEIVDLTNWSITDATDKATVLTGSIDAQSYFVIEAPKGKLNNSGDEVNLLDSSGRLIGAMSYGTTEIKSPSKGQSLSYMNNVWSETAPTKGAVNQQIIIEEFYDQPITALDPTTTESTVLQETETESAKNVAHVSTTSTTDNRAISLAKPTSTPVKKLTVAKVTTPKTTTKSSATKTTTMSGVITALPGTFGDQIMFVDGIQVYANNKDWPELSIGDVVTINGTLSTSHGEQRIKIKSSADVKTTDHKLSSAMNITSDQLANLPEGRLVTVEGTVAERTGDRLILEDDSGTITAVANSKTGLTWLDLPNSYLKITGVVRHIDGEALLYPRDANDIEFITDDLMPMATITGSIDAQTTTSINWLPYLAYVLLGGTLSVLAFWFLRSIKNPKTVN